MKKALTAEKKNGSISLDSLFKEMRKETTKVHTSGSEKGRANPVLETSIPQAVWMQMQISEGDSLVWRYGTFAGKFYVMITKQE